VRVSAAKSDVAAIEGALGQFSADTGRLPTDAEGLDALLTAPPGLVNWRGPYLQHPAKDPWGRPYVYRVLKNGEFDLRSAGPDGQANTGDDIAALIP
jgi:general secretion pathway protein G